MTADLHDHAAAYVLDALDPDERVEFEQHLAGCARCQQEVAEFSAVTDALAVMLEQAPPPRLRNSVLSRLSEIEQDPPAATDVAAVPSRTPAAPTSPPSASDETAAVIDLSARRRRFSPTVMLTAAAAVALLVVGAVVLNGLRDGSVYDDVVAAPDARVVELIGDAGSIEMVWSPERDQVALFGEGVVDLGPNLRYALWAIAGGQAIPAGLFEADDGTIRDVADVADVEADAWGITIEPATGSEQPTTDILFYAEL